MTHRLARVVWAAFGPEPAEQPDTDRLVILASKNVSRGKAAAAAVHAALFHFGIPHGAVIVLSASPSQIEAECEHVIRDAGRTEVDPGTVTAGVRRHDLNARPSADRSPEDAVLSGAEPHPSRSQPPSAENPTGKDAE